MLAENISVAGKPSVQAIPSNSLRYVTFLDRLCGLVRSSRLRRSWTGGQWTDRMTAKRPSQFSSVLDRRPPKSATSRRRIAGCRIEFGEKPDKK